jgi:hypothetical protein
MHNIGIEHKYYVKTNHQPPMDQIKWMVCEQDTFFNYI